MSVALRVVGTALIVMGVIWLLQGLNLLGGSFMTGQTQWAVIGVLVALLGAGMLFVTMRRHSS